MMVTHAGVRASQCSKPSDNGDREAAKHAKGARRDGLICWCRLPAASHQARVELYVSVSGSSSPFATLLLRVLIHFDVERIMPPLPATPALADGPQSRSPGACPER